MHHYQFHVTVAFPDSSTTLVSVRGDVDIATSPSLRRMIAAVQACGHRDPAHRGIVIDLSRVTLLDASGLDVLVTAARSADGYGLVLRNPSPSCMRVLEITRLASRFQIDAGNPITSPSVRCADRRSTTRSDRLHPQVV